MDKQQLIDQAFDKFEAELTKGIELSEQLRSCQYKTIEDTHTLVTSLLKIMGQEDFEKAFGITYKNICSLAEVEKDCYLILIDQIIVYHTPKILVKDYPDYKDLFDHKNKRLSINDYIYITCNESWDLWSAALGPIEYLQIKDPIDLPTYGPLFNQMAQEDNFIIGIQLAYLTHFYDIPLYAWNGYDT